MRHILAIDEGTSGVTCLMISEDGRVVGRGYREIAQYFPQPGWVEHDALEILECVRIAAGQAIAVAGAAPVAIGITNQRETVVIWERATGRPVHRAIVWQDRRTAERCRELAARTEWIAQRTGLVPDPYFSASKIEWLLREQRLLERYAPADLAVGTVDSWLIRRLTGGDVHATDATDASRTMLFDINTQAWSEELCDVFGVPMAMLPDVRRSSGDFVPALTGLGAPHWESRARGTIVSLTRGTGRAHLARAALEAMAYGTAEVLANMRDESGASFDRLRVDGGATTNDWLMQFQADILGVPVERPDMVETTALGAAGLAGLAAGVWQDADGFLATRQFTRFTPRMSRADAARLIAGWQRAVGAAVSWARDDREAT